jgi:hypothetical protein
MPDCSASDQSGTGIRGPGPAPEFRYWTDMSDAGTECLLCQICSGYPHQEGCFPAKSSIYPAKTTLHCIYHRPREWGRTVGVPVHKAFLVTVYMFAIGSWLHMLVESIPGLLKSLKILSLQLDTHEYTEPEGPRNRFLQAQESISARQTT